MNKITWRVTVNANSSEERYLLLNKTVRTDMIDHANNIPVWSLSVRSRRDDDRAVSAAHIVFPPQ